MSGGIALVRRWIPGGVFGLLLSQPEFVRALTGIYSNELVIFVPRLAKVHPVAFASRRSRLGEVLGSWEVVYATSDEIGFQFARILYRALPLVEHETTARLLLLDQAVPRRVSLTLNQALLQLPESGSRDSSNPEMWAARRMSRDEEISLRSAMVTVSEPASR